MSENLLTYDQAAAILHVSTRTIRRYVARRKIAVIRLSGRNPRIRPSALDRALETHTEQGIK